MLHCTLLQGLNMLPLANSEMRALG